MDISLNILLTDNETDCLFSLYMLSKQFVVHINYSNAYSKPRNKWALWIYSIFFSLKVCSLDLSFNYLLIHTFAPNCSDDCNSPYKFGGISYIVRYYFLGCETRHSKNVPTIDQYFKKYLPISILYFDGKNTDRFLCHILCNLKKKHSRFDARYWMLGAGALGWLRGMVRGGRREEGSGWGTRVYLWRIHVDIWQNQYNIVKLKKILKITHKI